MPKVHITDRMAKSVKTDAQVDYFDTQVPGLALRVSPNSKSWSLLYSRPGTRKRARITIGSFSDSLGVAKARKRAVELKSEIEAGKDPAAQRLQSASADHSQMTLEALVEDYLRRHVANLRSAKEIERRLRRNVIGDGEWPGKISLSELHKRDVVRAVDKVADRGARTEAARTFEDIRALVRWAIGRGLMDTDITAGMRAPKRDGVRNRILDRKELKALFGEIPALRPAVRDVVKLILETGCRVGEIAGLALKEVDLDSGLIRLPAERVKNAHTHQVPITSRSREILARLCANNTRYLFPVGDGPMRGDVLANELAKAQKGRGNIAPVLSVVGWTAHDLRRTWATLASELGVPPHVIAACLNHRSVNSSVTFAHYLVTDFLPERRRAHDLVSAELEEIERDADKVIFIGRRNTDKA
jgi:integrase